MIFLRSHNKYSDETRIELSVVNICHVFLFYRSMLFCVDTINKKAMQFQAISTFILHKHYLFCYSYEVEIVLTWKHDVSLQLS